MKMQNKGLMKHIKIFFSYIFYYLGDFTSWFLRFDCFAFLYPLYSKLMQISIELDPFGAIWKEGDPYSSDDNNE